MEENNIDLYVFIMNILLTETGSKNKETDILYILLHEMCHRRLNHNELIRDKSYDESVYYIIEYDADFFACTTLLQKTMEIKYIFDVDVDIEHMVTRFMNLTFAGEINSGSELASKYFEKIQLDIRMDIKKIKELEKDNIESAQLFVQKEISRLMTFKGMR